MEEIANRIEFAEEVYPSSTLKEMIQRQITNRAVPIAESEVVNLWPQTTKSKCSMSSSTIICRKIFDELHVNSSVNSTVSGHDLPCVRTIAVLIDDIVELM